MTTLTPIEFAVKSMLALLKQGGYGYDPETETCLYYDPKTNNRCAIGLLMTEDKAKELVESLGESSGDYTATHPKVTPYLPEGLSPHLAGCLQIIHDTLATRREPLTKEKLITRVRGDHYLGKYVSVETLIKEIENA